jgi:hypothetical protein
MCGPRVVEDHQIRSNRPLVHQERASPSRGSPVVRRARAPDRGDRRAARLPGRLPPQLRDLRICRASKPHLNVIHTLFGAHRRDVQRLLLHM